MLSDYCREIKNLHGNVSGKVPKLITSLRDKKKKICSHYSNLKLYMELGLKVTNVHRVLQFSQKKWLKPYITFNTEMRKNAKNSFEKDFFKLMNNSVFGKMENVRKRSNIKLATEEKQFLKLVAKPLFISHKIFDENLVGVNMKYQEIKLNKPSHVGMCILDLSKTLMYDFHYYSIRKKFPDCQLLFTDTDSLFFIILKLKEMSMKNFGRTGLYLTIVTIWNLLNSILKKIKKVIDKFKDEAAGKPILEFVGLKSKMYSYKKESGEIKLLKE